MGKWIDNKYVEDAEGEARCGFSRSYFCGYENKTEFCKNNNMTRTTLEKILIMLKQQFKDITLENILQEQANLSPQAVQLTQIEDTEEKKEEKKEEKDDKRINNGRTPQPFLGYSSLTEFCKKKHTFIQTVKKIIQQLNEQGIEITEENIFKQRDLNRHNTQAFRKDRPNTNIKQMSSVPDTEKANSESQESREPLAKIESYEPLAEIEEKEEVKKDDDMTKQDDIQNFVKNAEEIINNEQPKKITSLTDSLMVMTSEGYNELLEAQMQQRIKTAISTNKEIMLLRCGYMCLTFVTMLFACIPFALLIRILLINKLTIN